MREILGYNSFTDTLSGFDRSIGRLPEGFVIPGGMKVQPHSQGFKIQLARSIDPSSHALLEREFLSYHPSERDSLLQDFQALMPSAVYIPDRHIFFLVGGKPRMGLVEGVAPITPKADIPKDDPNVIGFYSNLYGQQEGDPFFEYYIKQQDTSNPMEELLVTVGIRLASNDFESINEEIKRLYEWGNLTEAMLRKIADPYLRVRVRERSVDDHSDDGGDTVSVTSPRPPIVPNGLPPSPDEDIL